MKKDSIHIGSLVERYIRQNGINASELARKLGMSRQNIYDIYKRDDLGVKEILSISKALDHDFLRDILENSGYVDMDKLFDVMKKMLCDRLQEELLAGNGTMDEK